MADCHYFDQKNFSGAAVKLSYSALVAAMALALALFWLFGLPHRQPNARLLISRRNQNILIRLSYDFIEHVSFALFARKKNWLPRRFEEKLQKLLNRSGAPLKLSAEEWALVSVLGVPLAAWILQLFNFPPSLGLLFPLVVALRLSSLQAERRAELRAQIPVYLEYLGLGLSAGLDFRGALVRVVDQGEGALGVELAELLASLELGVSRMRALRYWAERLELPEVHEWVRVIALAEQRGASLSQALQELARRQLEERSCRAEEAASRAGVYLILPLMLLLGAILLLLIGPMISGGEIF